MRALLFSAFCLLPSALFAQEADLSGLLVTAVHIEIEGRREPATDLRALIETLEGKPLDARLARESIAQLYAAGRFADVRVDAVPDGAGVALVYRLEPRHPVTRVIVRGNTGIAETTLRDALETRFEGLSAAPPAADATSAAVVLLRDEGFLSPQVAVRADVTHDPHATSLVFDVQAGQPAPIGTVRFEGTWPEPVQTVLGRLNARPGQPYRRSALRAAIDELVAGVRQTGYYAAQGSHTATPTDAGLVDLLIDADAGPVVDVRFEGDAMPRDRLDELVPIERERAVDIDLLEDSTIRIVNDLRREGYWRASATYRTAETNGRMQVTFTITRGPRYRLGALTVEGNRAVSAEALLSFVDVREGDIFVETPLESGANVIRDYYRRAGFTSADVVLDVAEAPRPPAGAGAPGGPGSDEARMNARMIVTEGPQSFVREVRFAGVTAIAEADLRRRMQSRAGEPFYLPFLTLDREAITRAYLDRGFQQAAVLIEPVFDAQGANLLLTIGVEEGPQTVVDRVIVVGNVRTDTQTVLDQLTLRQGSPLGLSDIVESQRRLSALGLFRRVRIAEGPRQPGSPVVDLVVTLEEAPATTIGYGAGLEVFEEPRTGEGGALVDKLEAHPRAFFEITRRNIAGGNRSLSLFTRVSLGPNDDVNDAEQDGKGFGVSEYRVVGTYRDPRPFGIDAEMLVSAGLEKSRRTSFSFTRDTLRTELLRRVSPSVRASARYSLEYTKLFDVRIEESQRLLIDRLFPQVRLSIVSGSILRDTRNDPVDPERGTLMGMDLDIAPRAIGSQVGFVKSFAQAFYFKRIPGRARIVLATGARLGLARGFSRIVDTDVPATEAQVEVRDLPASQRFFAGGSTTVRGFQLDRLGVPGILNSNGLSNGGNAMLVLNTELRVPVWKDLGAVAFVDAGNVFARVRDFAMADLRPTAGLGLRYRSPIGPLRVDIGFKLNREDFAPRREHRSEWHFSLGQAF